MCKPSNAKLQHVSIFVIIIVVIDSCKKCAESLFTVLSSAGATGWLTEAPSASSSLLSSVVNVVCWKGEGAPR